MGQCCAKGEVGGKAAETEDKEPVKKKEEPQDNEVVVRNGVMYDEFCDLVLTQYASGEVLTQNTTYADPQEAWRYTAEMLDTTEKGTIEWNDVERTINDLGAEFGQAVIMMELIETITRSKVKLRHLFATLDLDGGGKLSEEEFSQGLVKLHGREASFPGFRELWTMLDQDGDNEISWSEFLSGLSVEDVMGLHPNVEITQSMEKRPSCEDISGNEAAAADIPPEEDFTDMMTKEVEEAARIVQRFYRRNKARILMKNRIWQVTVTALDMGEENECNSDEDITIMSESVGGSSTHSEESADNENDQDDPAAPEEDTATPQSREDSLLKVFQNLRERRELPPRAVAASIIFEVSRLHKLSRNVAEIKIPPKGLMHVIGDIHGQLEDVLLILDDCGLPSPMCTFLFNGDFVDRGQFGVEVLLLLYTMKLLWPDHVHLNRGNHEARRLNEKYGFDVEVSEKYDLQLFKNITRSFCMLPLAHIVEDHFFVIHGGLSSEPDVSIEDYNKIDRFRQVPRREESLCGPIALRRYARLFEGAMWSDPREVKNWEESKRGAGVFFGKAIVENFLKKNGLKKIIRSHESYQPGYCEHHDRQTLTVFSASNYCGVDDNQGCFLTIHPNCEVRYRQYRVASSDLLQIGKNSRMSSGISWKGSACEDSLRRIRNLIFCQRSALMHEFQAVDTEKTGKVSSDDWVAIMNQVINDEVPWRCIMNDIVIMEKDGKVAYVPYLERYQNLMQQRMIQSWVEKMMKYLGGRMKRFVDELAQSTPGISLSYYEMCESLRKHIPGLGESSAYHIVLALDENKDGFIDVGEFTHAFSKLDLIDPKSCVIELWEMATFDQISFMIFKRAFQKQVLMANRTHGSHDTTNSTHSNPLQVYSR